MTLAMRNYIPSRFFGGRHRWEKEEKRPVRFGMYS